MAHQNKLPIVGFSIGDLNGIGIELILKTFADGTMFERCVPIVFGSHKVLNFYKKLIPEVSNLTLQTIRDFNAIGVRQLSIINCWDEMVDIHPGQMNSTGGKYASISLLAATQALQRGQINVLVTAPINKTNIRNEQFNFVGHTPFFKSFFGAQEVLMLMVSDNLKVTMITEHIPIREISNNINQNTILKKLQFLNKSLKEDFLILRPRIAVLGLNPHSGDDGLIGNEEKNLIIPAIQTAYQEKIFAFGPYSSDAFFARGQYHTFDAVLAMYHDQALIPFKSLSTGEGVNYTAGLDVVRTSPDHGTAFDIAGKNMANNASFREAIFKGIDIYRNKLDYKESIKNPLKKYQIENPVEDEVVENIKEE